MLQSFTPLPVSAQVALEPAASLSREQAGGDVNCKLARMTRPEPTPAEEPKAGPSANQEARCKTTSYLLKPVARHPFSSRIFKKEVHNLVFSAPRAQFTFSTPDVSHAFHKLDAPHLVLLILCLAAVFFSCARLRRRSSRALPLRPRCSRSLSWSKCTDVPL